MTSAIDEFKSKLTVWACARTCRGDSHPTPGCWFSQKGRHSGNSMI